MENNFFSEVKAVILGLGELRVGTCPMGTIGLGSCVALILHDRRRSLGGLAHIMLPESRGNADRPGKCADTAATTPCGDGDVRELEVRDRRNHRRRCEHV